MAYMNVQNYRVCSLEKLYVFQTTLFYPQKLDIWSTMSHKCVAGPIFLKQQLIQRFATILFGNLLHFCIKMNEKRFFNKIMCDRTWRKTRCPFWQNFWVSEFASSRYIAQIWARWTIFFGVFSRILSIRIPFEVLQSSRKICGRN